MFDFEGIGALDATALDGLAELCEHMAALDVEVLAVARANQEVLARLRHASLLEPAGRLRAYPTINGAVRAYRQRHSG